MDNHVREGLKNFQQALDLKDEDIARLEAPLLKAREAEHQKQQAEKLRQQQEAERLQQQETERLREQQRKRESEESEQKLRQQEEATRTRQTQVEQQPKASNALIYAGRRAIAFMIDALISFVIVGLAFSSGVTVQNPNGTFANWFIANFGVLLYHILFEISPFRATIGKVMLGLQVSDLYGKKVDFFKSLFRFILKASSIACFVGILYLGVALLNTKKKQGIHDLMMGTVVVLKEEG